MTKYDDALKKDITRIFETTPGISVEDAATQILNDRFLSEEDAAYVKPALAAYAATTRKLMSLNVEKQVFTTNYSAKQKANIQHAVVDPHIQLLKGAFTVPTKGTVLWGDATVEDHQAHIVYLNTKMSGYHAQIRNHTKAIDLLNKYNKNTLGELDPELLKELSV